MATVKNTERFTVYMTTGERAALRLLARRLSLSENAVMKLFIRHFGNLDVPVHHQEQLDSLVDSPVLFGEIHL